MEGSSWELSGPCTWHFLPAQGAARPPWSPPSFTVGCHLSRGRRLHLQVLSFWAVNQEKTCPYSLMTGLMAKGRATATHRSAQAVPAKCTSPRGRCLRKSCRNASQRCWARGLPAGSIQSLRHSSGHSKCLRALDVRGDTGKRSLEPGAWSLSQGAPRAPVPPPPPAPPHQLRQTPWA